MQIIQVLFISSSIVLLFAYPITWVFTRFVSIKKTDVQTDISNFPRFTIIVAAYNEENIIQKKIENFYQLKYPADRLDMVIVSDMSTDNTNDIVNEYCGDRVKLVNYGERLGKTLILNRTMPNIKGDFAVLTDANIMFKEDVIQRFARKFELDKIGLICGYEERRVPDAGKIIETETTYRDFEVRIKALQSLFGSVLGAHGGLYSIRKNLWTALPSNALSNDDLLTGLNVLKQGFEVILEPKARAVEDTGTKLSDEFKRRVRIGAGNYQAFGWHMWLLNPFEGWKSIFFWLHKLPRWFTPHLMIIAFITNYLTIDLGMYYLVVFYLQVVFYTLTTIGWILDRVGNSSRIFSAPYHFASMNLAVFLGFFHWIKGIKSSTWEPPARDKV
jgi:poly-beta-1,6-N-acetyl-D-glucosamine synthase